MIMASELRPGMAIRYEGKVYKVINASYHPGQGQMGGVTHARLMNLETGSFWDHSFRADMKLEDLDVEKRTMQFLYEDGENYYFMDPQTFEQYPISAERLGKRAQLLKPEMEVMVEFIEGQPVNVIFPDLMEATVVETAPPIHAQQDSTWKEAVLDNGLKIMVPLFIKTGDVIRIDTTTLEYRERARTK